MAIEVCRQNNVELLSGRIAATVLAGSIAITGCTRLEYTPKQNLSDNPEVAEAPYEETSHVGHEELSITPNQLSHDEHIVPGAVEDPEPPSKAVVFQSNLNESLVKYGMPELELDRAVGRQTRRAFCAAQYFSVNESIAVPSDTDIETFESASTLSTSLSGFIINRTCQVLGANLDDDPELELLVPVSTGKGGRTTKGEFTVQFGRNYDHTSTLYPDDIPNMYRPIYFNGPIAFHGSPFMFIESTTARSHGCVRLLDDDMDTIWSMLGGPTEVATGPGRSRRVILPPVPVHVVD